MIWEHFDICDEDPKYAKCNYCDKKVRLFYMYFQLLDQASAIADLAQFTVYIDVILWTEPG